MTEPVYTFVKGEGWVLQPAQIWECVDGHGVRYRMENRLPKPEDYYVCLFRDSPYFGNGEINYPAFVKRIRELRHLQKFGYLRETNYHNDKNTQFITLALVPL